MVAETQIAPRRRGVKQPIIALHPAALRILGQAALLELQVVPYAIGASMMAIASSTAEPGGLARELSQRTGLSVEVAWAPPDEITAALEAALVPERAAAALAARAGEWLAALGHGSPLSVPFGRSPGAQVAPALEQDWLEALSLASGRPLISLATWRSNPALAPLLSQETAFAEQAAPLLIVDRVLLLALAVGGERPAPARWRELATRVAGETGLTVQVALAPHAELRPLIARLYRQGNGAPLPFIAEAAGSPGSPLGAITRRVLRATGIEDDAALVRRQGMLLPAADLAPAPALRSLLPRPLAERFQCLALDQVNGVLHVAAPPNAPASLAPLLTAVTGQPVRVIAAAAADLPAAITRAYFGASPRDTTQPSLGAYLLAGEVITAETLSAALAEQEVTGEPLDAVLVRSGALRRDALAEALALCHDLPYLQVARALPEAEAVRQVPSLLAREERAFAVRVQEGTLHVALADPGNAASVERIERASGRRVRPLLGDAAEIAAAIERISFAGGGSLAPATRAFLEGLVGRRLLDRARFVTVSVQVAGGAPLDEALSSGGFSEREVIELLAEAAALPVLDLWPHDELARVTDALGNATTRHRLVDPLDPVAARRLSLAAAERRTILPVEASNGHLVVAVADPFDSEALAEVQAELNAPVQFAIAGRAAIQAGIRRTLGRRQLGDYLLGAGLVSRDELDRALTLARRSDVRIGKALLTLGYVSQEQLSLYLSEQFAIPYFDLTDTAIDPAVARALPEPLARSAGMLPLALDEHGALLAMVDPSDTRAIEEAAAALDRPVTPVLTTERQIDVALESIYRSEYVERASLELLARSPEDSAARVWTRAQLGWLAALALALAGALTLRPLLTLALLTGAATLFSTLLSGYKLILIHRSLTRAREETVSAEEIAALDERALPVYTVLVPMYREAAVLPALIDALNRLAYPRTKLDVILLLEEDDAETRAAVRAMRLPEGFRALVLPPMEPKTKPKACNYGLLHAEGEFTVIYDAEDAPEPDQLAKAVVVFRRHDERLVAIQSKLNYFNRDQNLLTRWFTVEYSMWFDLLLPGLDSTGAPIPLGGTSNHFRTESLRALGGWDPFNTTEDADLGLRIFKRGFRTVVMDSTTYEEANSDLHNWVRQRSRWVKGYMQTWLVHMRHPIQLYQEMGFRAFCSFHLLLAGTFLTFLLNPLLWLVTALWFVSRWRGAQILFPAPVLYLGAIGLYAGNFAFMYMNVAGALRRGYHHLVKYALLSPVYWMLMSVAAWQALYELIFRPHYWQKTEHGLFQGRRRLPRPPQPPSPGA